MPILICLFQNVLLADRAGRILCVACDEDRNSDTAAGDANTTNVSVAVNQNNSLQPTVSSPNIAHQPNSNNNNSSPSIVLVQAKPEEEIASSSGTCKVTAKSQVNFLWVVIIDGR